MLSSQSAAVAQAGTKLSQVLTCVAQVLAIADCRQLTALVGHAVLAQVSNALIAASSAGKPVVPQPVAQELRVPPPVMHVPMQLNTPGQFCGGLQPEICVVVQPCAVQVLVVHGSPSSQLQSVVHAWPPLVQPGAPEFTLCVQMAFWQASTEQGLPSLQSVSVAQPPRQTGVATTVVMQLCAAEQTWVWHLSGGVGQSASTAHAVQPPMS